ncbi:chemotaxis protein CheA [Enterovirga sp. CN4-39]|uniref:chemotaxis protein CheA n=1 Tax=Enterovirga sp. CN4-39 TaxID=3400910 RepID=UPI003BFD5097
MDPLASIKVTFFQECEEQLAELEVGLLAMKEGECDSETVNAVFRAVHSIKGGAGAFSLTDLVRFAHVFETVLDEMRAGRLAPDGPILDVMLRASDVLADLVRATRDGTAMDEARAQALMAELGELTGTEQDASAGDEFLDLDFAPIVVAIDLPESEPAPLEGVVAPAESRIVTFKPTSALYAKANEPAVLLRELASLGRTAIELDASTLPLLDALEPEAAYFRWTARVATADEAAIREVFDFVEGDCELAIDNPDETAFAGIAPVPVEPATAAVPLDELDIKALIARATGGVTQVATATPEAARDASEQPVAEVIPLKEHPARAAEPQARKEEVQPVPAASPTIRVDLDRVDRLIDLVGELVINQAMLAQRVLESGVARSSGIVVGLDDLELLTREIQDSVMAIRAQPVKSVFQRMPRLVREVASATGKQVRLVVEGEGTEVDKTVIERLTDPITHMIRNAIDHGLESPERRREAGKPAEGVVRLSALHRSGRIVIEVSDDGGGINRRRVREIAVGKGLIPPDASLSDEETDNLIFMPGFSTAETVSDISGRGVGMDVVRRSIQALGGRISIASRPGQGSTFTLSLPLTLAVLDGMVVSVGGQTFVLPITAVMETLQPKAAAVRNLAGSVPLLLIRGRYVPILDIGHRLGYRPTPIEPTEGVALLVEGEDGRSAALLVDQILGQRQVVIKSLEANYQRVAGIAAATILGDGRVALILDVDAVIAGPSCDAAAITETRLLAAG